MEQEEAQSKQDFSILITCIAPNICQTFNSRQHYGASIHIPLIAKDLMNKLASTVPIVSA